MKKSFTESLSSSPAMSFISGAKEPEQAKTAPREKSAEHSKEPKSGAVSIPRLVKPEAKSKRLQLLVKPSLYRALKVMASKEGDSVNNLINRILEAHAHV